MTTVEMMTSGPKYECHVLVLSLIGRCKAGCDNADAAGGTMGSGYKNPGGDGRGYVERLAIFDKVACSDEGDVEGGVGS